MTRTTAPRKNLLMVLTVLLATFVQLGCDSRPSHDRTREFKLAYVMAPAGAAHEAAQRFADLVQEKTNNRITVKLFPSAQLGNDRELAEGLTFGSVHFVMSGLASISWYVPQYEVLEAPFVFRGYEHLDHVVNGPIGQEVADALLEATGIRILDWWYRGPRYLTTNKKIRTPSDLKGLKLRVPELPTYIEAWRILGTNPTPITYDETFMALRQGIVEGQENPLEVIYTSSLYEVQEYVTRTRHLMGSYMLMTSDRLFESLSVQDQQAIKEAAVEAGKYEFKLMLEYEQRYVEELEKRGMAFVDVDVNAFREPVIKRLPEAFKDKWAPGLFERIQDTK